MPEAAAALQRCFWVDGSDLYAAYHDHEWGRPVSDDIRLFEKMLDMLTETAGGTATVDAVLSSQSGEVYMLLAEASGRLDR